MGRGMVGPPPVSGGPGGPGGMMAGPASAAFSVASRTPMPGQQQQQKPPIQQPPPSAGIPVANAPASNALPPDLGQSTEYSPAAVMAGTASAPPAGVAGVGGPGLARTEVMKQPVEFDHAINYVTTIKKRFASHPEIYRKFLEILHTYQKEQRGIKEVLDEVSLLFADHADLLKEFTYFLPDAVQSQAKAQLDVAAKKAEERAKAREAARLKQKDSMTGLAPPGPAVPAAAAPMGRGRGGMVLPPAPPPPPPPTAAGSRYGGGMTLHPPAQQPVVPSHVAKVPFGATKGRSKDREVEIKRGVVHGNASFGPVRPPRRNELNPAQAAQLFGRPTAIPSMPLQPMTSETAFFEHVKTHFLRRDLFPDKPIVNRKQTPYMEFIKCLHLFGAGILNKDELIQILRGLFIQGNTPKSGANATNTGNVMANAAAMALLSELEKVLVGRGPFATQEQTKKLRSKYGSYPIRCYDLADADDADASKQLTPSYWSNPKDFVFAKSSGDEKDNACLNYECLSMAQDWSNKDNKGERYLKSPEEYDGIKIRRNAFEEVLARVEDEMHEVDMAIERNASAMRVLEPVSEEATRLREQEEKDGQPIGRLQYKMRNRALNSIHIGAIARVYGESGEEVLQHLMRNPLVVVPIVFKRLKEKNEEWRKVKKELNKEWKKTCSENISGSLDVKCIIYKQEIERSFARDKLLEECHKAKSFAKHPSKIQRHRATNMILPDFHLLNPDPMLVLFQPHLSVLVSKNMPHKHAYHLLEAYFTRDAKSSSDKKLFMKVWADFIAPWFGLPKRWDDSDSTHAASKGAASTVKFIPGQRVRTAVGDGEIIAVMEGKTPDSFRYLVKFSFGVGYVQPSAVAHLLPSSGIISDMGTSLDVVASKLMQDDIQVLFGTENIYVLMRLYILLVTMLYQAKGSLSGYSDVMSSLQKLIQGKIVAKDFEAECRANVDKAVYNFVVIPPLVEKCADALVRVAKEDFLENLYHCSKLKLKDLHQLRNLSLGMLTLEMTDEPLYRIQIQSSASRVFFSCLPAGVELQLANPLDVMPSAPTEHFGKPVEADAKRLFETKENPAANREGSAFEPQQKRSKTEGSNP